MKKIIYICILSLLLPSCDLLKEKPTTRLLDGSAFDTEPALEAQVTGLYGTLPSTFFSNNWFYYFNCSSQLVHWKGTRNGLLFEQSLRGTLFADQSTGRGLMTSMYATINKCNILLEGLKNSPVDEAYKTKIEGETLMIRGMMYFYLVRIFGNVPIHITSTTSDKAAYVKRDSYLDVYVQIIADLNNAFDKMPALEEMSGGNVAAGRPHKYAAKALLAQVYLQIGSMLNSPDDQAFGTLESGEIKPDFKNKNIGINSAADAWELALNCADEVIGCGAYALESNYANLFNWDPTSPNNAFFSREKIITVQMTPNGGSSTASLYTLPGYMVGTQNAISLTHASNPGMIRPSRYVFQRWARTYGGQTRAEGEDTFYTSCNDPRLDASYIYNSYEATADDSGNKFEDGAKKMTIYPSTNGSDQCYFKKYFYPQFDQDAGYADLYLLRLAEMYFIAAEASAQLGKNGVLGDAYAYIGVLHNRAQGKLDSSVEDTEFPKWDNGQFASTEELVTAIFWERVYEMGGEGHEWFDSHRLGAKWLLENVNEPLHRFLQEPGQSSYRNTYWYGRGYELPLTLDNVRNCLMCDYPKYEILYNQALTSNDQNYFNSSKAVFNVSGGGNSSNESYDDEEDNLVW